MGGFKDMLASDYVAYGIGIPVVAGFLVWLGSIVGIPVAAFAVPSLLLAGITVGILRYAFGVGVANGMTRMELDRAAGISVVASIVLWAASQFGKIPQAAALMKAADTAAQSAAAAAANGFGKGAWAFLSGVAVLFSAMFASIALGNLTEDFLANR